MIKFACLLLFFASLPVMADSDAYYCVGPSYFAYERRFEKFDGELRHTLYEVTAGGKSLWNVRTYVFPDFQVHGLKCGNDAIEVLSWESIFTIVRQGKKLELSKTTKLPEAGKLPSGYEASWFRRIEPEQHGQKSVDFPGDHSASKTFDRLEYSIEQDYKRCVAKLVVRLRRYEGGKPDVILQPKLVGEKMLFTDEQNSECAD